jgi:hypothetical protein
MLGDDEMRYWMRGVGCRVMDVKCWGDDEMRDWMRGDGCWVMGVKCWLMME